jgi:DNA-binding transcriptional ArsR family regulator
VNDARLTELLRALAHEERVRLVRACRGEARAAGELAAASGLAPASVSEHLKVLRKTGLLVLEIRGRFRLYRTDDAVVREVGAAVERLLIDSV